ncbi:uncharacterized protein LOC126632187 [Malus sylvestris]|uniref:uncharacterized protein LOC126632187 n=1 Tax=Malus sylvestris TaxID=3752 RepID=UPI0021AD02EF|nr:uncharacterized protein LOC126632187 [Malus sylvestris]
MIGYFEVVTEFRGLFDKNLFKHGCILDQIHGKSGVNSIPNEAIKLHRLKVLIAKSSYRRRFLANLRIGGYLRGSRFSHFISIVILRKRGGRSIKGAILMRLHLSSATTLYDTFSRLVISGKSVGS